MDERTHPVSTGGRRFRFTGNLQRATTLIQDSINMADEPIMREFLEPIGRVDTLLDLRDAVEHLATVLADLDALPPKVEFVLKEG